MIRKLMMQMMVMTMMVMMMMMMMLQLEAVLSNERLSLDHLVPKAHPFYPLNMLCQNDDEDNGDDDEKEEEEEDANNDDNDDVDWVGGIDKWIWLERTRCTHHRNVFQLKRISSEMCQDQVQ